MAAPEPRPGGCVAARGAMADVPAGRGGWPAGRAPGNSLCARREELFAGPLEELLLRLGDQVSANLGDENWGLEGRRKEEVVSKEGAQGRATGAPHSCWVGARLPLPLHLALGCLHSVPWCREVAGLKVVNEPRFLLCHFQLV